MHEPDEIREGHACKPLEAALRALPLAAPPRDALPALKAAFRAARPAARDSRRAAFWTRAPIWTYAAAAGLVALAAALWLQRPLHHTKAPPTVVTTPPARAPLSTTPRSVPLAQLVAQNQVYETALRSPGLAGAPENAGLVLAEAQLGDLIGMIDLELAASTDPADEASLWARRLVLLRELTALRAGGAQLDPTVADAAHYQSAAWPLD